MASESDKWIEVIARLIELTQDKRMVWRPYRPSDLSNSESIKYGTVFMSDYEDHRVRIYKKNIYFDPSRSSLAAQALGVGIKMNPSWTSRVVMEFLADPNQPIWSVPDVKALNDLLRAVEYQVSGVGDFISKILKK